MRLQSLPAVMIRVPFEIAKGAIGVAAGAARGAYGLVAGGEEAAPPERDPDFASRTRPPEPAESGNGRARDPQAEAAAAAERWREPAVAAEPEPEVEPVHLDEEPELVAEVAEEGAEGGAGAEVSIQEPWPGYDEMTAADIEDRLVSEDETVVGAVKLYEASRKGRASVLEAASRSMSG
jgi:hypothetical protein